MFKWLKKLFTRKSVQSKPSPAIPASAELPAWYLKAQGELGQKEVVGFRNNPRIVEYHSTTFQSEDDETPWCASFVSWCLEKTGHKSTKSAWARSYLAWGKPCEPKLGCIVVLQRGGVNAKTGHVGFYVKSNLLTVTLLGGNQSDSVCYATYPRYKVLGYRWPND